MDAGRVTLGAAVPVPMGNITTAIAVAVTVTGCGLSAAQVRERNLCYTRADGAAQKRVDQECADSFTTCLAADDILTELRANQEACK